MLFLAGLQLIKTLRGCLDLFIMLVQLQPQPLDLRSQCQAAALLGITGVSYWRLGTIPAERLGL